MRPARAAPRSALFTFREPVVRKLVRPHWHAPASAGRQCRSRGKRSDGAASNLWQNHQNRYMDYKLTTLTGLLIVVLSTRPLPGQAVPRVSLTPLPPGPGSAPASGAELIDQVVERIGQYSSISANVRHRTEM